MKYYLSPTPHGTYRVFITKDIFDKEDTLKILNFLSCWDGIDKVTDQLVSWEFPISLPSDYVVKALSRVGYQQVEVLEW